MALAWLFLLLSSLLMVNQVHATVFVNITTLDSAIAKGAVCLDGSPPAYYYYKGFGGGAYNWIVYLEGGGWCNSTKDCKDRSQYSLGSSRANVEPVKYFSGILDDDCVFNPDFCQWHKVLTFRGARIFDAVIQEMVAKGLGDAQNAILAGSSAGGLSTILHCDKFHRFLPNVKRVKCISDSGFFIRGDNKGLPGVEIREIDFSKDVVETHELANLLPPTCTSKRSANLCLFPEYLVGDIQTPLFILDSLFDAYQVSTNLLPDGVGNFINCTKDITLCDATQLSIMRDFRSVFIETLMNLNNSSSRGMFVHTCYRHVHILGRDGWTCSSVDCNVLSNKTIGQAIGDWYFDRALFHEIDTHNDTPFNCTRDKENADPNYFSQKCLAALHPGF